MSSGAPASWHAANKELETFSYSISHDLRAPLRAIDGYSYAVLEDYGKGLPEGARADLARVREASQRMSTLIDELLGLSRITRRELLHVPVDLSALADGDRGRPAPAGRASATCRSRSSRGCT